MTAQTLQDALSASAAVVAGVSGVNSSPSYAQFNINERIISLNYVMTSDVEISEIGTKQHLATIAHDLLTPLVGMTNELDTMLGIADGVTTAFVQEASSGGDMFSNAMMTFSNCRIEFLPFYPYNNIPHIGYRVMLEGVKLKLDL